MHTGTQRRCRQAGPGGRGSIPHFVPQLIFVLFCACPHWPQATQCRCWCRACRLPLDAALVGHGDVQRGDCAAQARRGEKCSVFHRRVLRNCLCVPEQASARAARPSPDDTMRAARIDPARVSGMTQLGQSMPKGNWESSPARLLLPAGSAPCGTRPRCSSRLDGSLRRWDCAAGGKDAAGTKGFLAPPVSDVLGDVANCWDAKSDLANPRPGQGGRSVASSVASGKEEGFVLDADGSGAVDSGSGLRRSGSHGCCWPARIYFSPTESPPPRQGSWAEEGRRGKAHCPVQGPCCLGRHVERTMDGSGQEGGNDASVVLCVHRLWRVRAWGPRTWTRRRCGGACRVERAQGMGKAALWERLGERGKAALL